MNTPQVQPTAQQAFTLRESCSLDEELIHGTWKECLRYSSLHTRGIDSGVYFPRQEAIIQRLLARSTVLCAVCPDDHDLVFGYIVFEPARPPVIHFAYVKAKFRKAGIGRALLTAALQAIPEESVFVATAYTDALAVLMRTKHPRIIVDPYRVHD